MSTFAQHKDPLTSLRVGKRKLIEDWLLHFDQFNKWIINDDLTIDVSSIGIINRNLKSFPDYIQFNKITHNFSCSQNELSSLKGGPLYVGGNFYCYQNNLTSLKYLPKYIGGNLEYGPVDKETLKHVVQGYIK